MSGHSHWSTIKHKKGATDAKRGQQTSKLMNIVHVALREGANPAINPKLRGAIERAKAGGVSQELIDRALTKREQTTVEEVIYEGYGPQGVALLIKVLTDNRNRTVSELRHWIVNHGGKLSEPGSVAWMFEERGVVRIPTNAFHEEWLMELADLGVADVREEDGETILVADPKQLYPVRQALEAKGATITAAELSFLPKSPTAVSSETMTSIERFSEELLDQPDVDEVYLNLV